MNNLSYSIKTQRASSHEIIQYSNEIYILGYNIATYLSKNEP